MLTIRQEQMEVFRRIGRQQQALALARRLLDDPHYGAGLRDEYRLAGEITQDLEAWETLDIVDSHHWLALLEFKHLLSLDLDEAPVRNILTDRELSADERLELLSEQALERSQES